jgi:uncharacterized surface protein with fasciclin (FAS1) repeats
MINNTLVFLSTLFLASMLSAEPQKDIVDTAVDAGDFKTLVSALKQADLVETLKGEGPFTVFAPTDEAFKKFWPETLKNLLKPENKDKLQLLLTYHVVPGKVKSKKAMKLDTAVPLSGGSLRLSVKSNILHVNHAKVIKADIKTTNGIIHVIDAVLVPNVSNKTASNEKCPSTQVRIINKASAHVLSSSN